MYYDDDFQKPAPFRPDVVVNIDDVWETKINGLDAHVSQMYEWLPLVGGVLDQVPKDLAARKVWLGKWRQGQISPAARAALEKRYGADQAQKIQHVESFELCEYGRKPSLEELQQLFPK
jgi:hypothetical protein